MRVQLWSYTRTHWLYCAAVLLALVAAFVVAQLYPVAAFGVPLLAMALPKSSADVVKKTLDRARGQGTAWEQGMSNASGTIVSNARAAAPRWKQAILDAIQGDRYLKGLGNVTDDQIITAAKKVGGAAWENGLTSREDKLRAAWDVLLPKLQSHVTRIKAMPNVTDADREKRMLENLRGMRQLGLS